MENPDWLHRLSPKSQPKPMRERSPKTKTKNKPSELFGKLLEHKRKGTVPTQRYAYKEEMWP